MYEEEVRHTNVIDGVGVDARVHAGIRAVGLGKQFGDLWALRDLDLDVEPGTVLGLLGHNGAGKTTAIRMLTTLSIPTEGQAWVAGFDVAARPRRGPPAHRGRLATVDRRSVPERSAQPRVDRPPQPSPAQGRPRPGRRTARTARTHRVGRQAREVLLGRHAAADRSRRVRRGEAERARARRADDRPRPPQPRGPVADAARSRGRRHDAAADHAVSRGGRPARRSHRAARSRAHRRRRVTHAS